MHRVAYVVVLWVLLAGSALGQEEGEAPAPVAEPLPAPTAIDVLPEAVIQPPSIYGTDRDRGPVEVETPLRREILEFDAPAAVTVQDGAYLRQRKMVRSLPDALLRLPGVLVQKTAPLQSSPFIRGFTGYRNLVLIDGIRFNNAAFRAGPNQYWSTIDPYTIERLELARGPFSVQYGSDAVGGTVNVITQRRESFCPGWHFGGLVSARVASAENMAAARYQVEGNYGNFGFLGGISLKQYGDIESGGGRLPRTGSPSEFDGDFRIDVPFRPGWRFVAAYQHVEQEDAPRTHRTIASVPFRGTEAGSELWRLHDQHRDLAYARVVFACDRGAVREAYLGVSFQRHWDERDRLRTRGRRDFTGFELYQYGVQAQATLCTPIGLVTFGADYYRDEADTWRRNFVDGVLTSTAIQGAFGDDSRYDLFGAYVEDQITLGRLDLFLGARFTYAAAEADRVELPTAPGVASRISNDWTKVVGSLRAVYHLTPTWNVYGAVAQAFRAPTLYDLTSFDVTGFVERPNPDLEPEDFVTFEVGVKTQQERLAGYAAFWYTILDGTLVRSPTGDVVDDVAVVQTENIGDGWVWGFEIEVATRAHRDWVAFANLSTMDGEADEFDADLGRIVRSPLSRQKPLTFLLGARYEPPGSPGWFQAEVAFSDREDRLSLRDRTDLTRIPPDGTPGWTVVNLRGGYRVGDRVHLGIALENLFDENYRIHGSGQNEAGLNLVATIDVEF